jgi:hypothetical protein
MADVVNLRRVRKARQRAEKETAAAENRARFGRTRAERDKATAEAEIAARRLDGLRRTPEDRGDGGA